MAASPIARTAVASTSTPWRRGRSGNARAARHQFSVTAGTIFADRKRPIRDYLLAIAIFANGAKGHSALQLSRDLDCQYKTAFVLAHKLREAIEAEQRKATFAGVEKEIDGAYFGGHVKPKNEVAERVDRRLAEEQTGKRQVVVVMRERNGRTLPFVFGKESDAIPTIREPSRSAQSSMPTKRAAGMRCTRTMTCAGSIIRSRSARTAPAPIKRRSYFSRLRRAEIGVHHRISGRDLRPPTLPKWHGAKITAASRTARSSARSPHGSHASS